MALPAAMIEFIRYWLAALAAQSQLMSSRVEAALMSKSEWCELMRRQDSSLPPPASL